MIALEEHFAIAETLGDSQQYAGLADTAWQTLRTHLLDLDGGRLAEMDAHGIRLAILSLNSPAIQAIADPAEAIRIARLANNTLAAAVTRHPDRFAGFAALPMQDVDAAIAELTRSVRELGFLGALVNGFSEVAEEAGLGRSATRPALDVVYYDDPRYLPFWAAVEELDVPVYLHPRDPLPEREPILDGHPWLGGPVWAFTVETATHALRLMASGLFDRYPRLRIILGHLGEGLPFSIWRIDHRLRKANRGIPAERPLGDYLRRNFYLTTSGNFSTTALRQTIDEVGTERVLFSVDHPFERTADGVSWFNGLDLPAATKAAIASGNAEAVFKVAGPA